MSEERKALIVSIFFVNPSDLKDAFIQTTLLSCFVHYDLGDQRVADYLASIVVQMITVDGKSPMDTYRIGHVGVREIFASELEELLPMARRVSGAYTVEVPDPASGVSTEGAAWAMEEKRGN